MPRIFLFILTLTYLTGCAGYRFRNLHNPFGHLGINSISLPMFVNRSTLGNVAGPFTQEIFLLLASFPGLKVSPGRNTDADAVLVGVITSPEHIRDTLRTSDIVEVSGELGHFPSLKDRRKKFWVPKAKEINLKVQLVLIQNPTDGDIDYVLGAKGEWLYSHPRIIFSENFSIGGGLKLEVADPRHGGENNFTKNYAVLDKVINQQASDLAIRFRENILYAF